MPFIATVPDDAATGDVAALYEEARAQFGIVPNLVRGFSSRPAVYRAWQQLNAAIKEHDARRYELATLAAARRLRSSYCSLAHGRIVARDFLGADGVVAFPDGLDEAERAVVSLAEKVVDDAVSVTAEDVERLRRAGLADDEIADVVLAAAARCFFSKTLDALGIQPDAAYAALDAPLRDALVVGRPIESNRV